MKKLSVLFVLLALVFSVVAPSTVSAQQSVVANCQVVADTQSIIAGFFCRIALLLNTVVPILITLAVVYFIWGVVNYVLGKSEEAKKEGKDRMIWGLIGLAVIVSIWGLVAILRNFTFVDQTNDSAISVPCIESPGVFCPTT